MKPKKISESSPLNPKKNDEQNNEQSQDLEANQISPSPVSYPQAAWNVTSFSLPFTISRLAVAVNVLTNGSITPKIGPNAAAAGPQMISIVYAVLGPGRSILLATGILVGKKYGELQELLKSGKTLEAKEIQEAIGDQLRQSTTFGTMLAIPSIAFMVGMGPILRAAGIAPALVTEIEGFLNSTATGLLPIYWSTSDQQFAMAIGHKYIPMIFGTLFPLLSMGFGYPFALGSFGLPKLGTAGLGYGMSAAAWLSFAALRLYFLKPEFEPYRIYKVQFRGLFNQFSDLLKLGLPLGFQALTEWGNMFFLSALIARKGGNASMAANGSFQIITAATLITAALGQGISIKISEQLGKMKIAEQLGKFNELKVINKNLKRIGNAGIVTGALATTGLMAFLVSMPKQIQSVFVSHDDPEYQEIMIMAQAMLITNAVGLIFDTVRNMSASALSGSKDVMFAPLISLLTMSMMALGVGALLTEHFDLDANWLFITRDVGILAAAFAVSIRWLMKNHEPELKEKSTVTIEELPDEPNEPTAPAHTEPTPKNKNYGTNGSTFFYHQTPKEEQKYLLPKQLGYQ
ncbi:hypothetical protein ACNVED_10305 [Legionella sp. D16C41]|uniref:hypothetical protein n=1 Tax=Legionella sp. D16C41 TaxID=3402688 RepID=UPI003AF4F519